MMWRWVYKPGVECTQPETRVRRPAFAPDGVQLEEEWRGSACAGRCADGGEVEGKCSR